MFGRLLRAGVLIVSAGALFVALGSSGAAARPGKKTTKLSCTSTSYNVSYPQLSGLTFGILKCGKPFGDGVQQATTTTSVVGPKLNVTGTLKNFYDNGTNHGTFKMSGTFSPGTITASGSVNVTGGTRAYAHMKGKGALTCATTNAGKTFECKVSGTATF